MALQKAPRYIVLLLVMWNSVKYEGYRESLNVCYEELMGAKESSIYSRQNRESNSIEDLYEIPDDCTVKFTYQSESYLEFNETATLLLSKEKILCKDMIINEAPENYSNAAAWKEDEVGEKSTVYMESGLFEDKQDTCILRPIKELLDQSEFLTVTTLPVFLEQLNNVTVNLTDGVVESPANIRAIVKILTNVAKKSSSLNISVSRASMEDILITAGVLTTEDAKTSWDFLNMNTRNISYNNLKAESVSSSLLKSLETLISQLNNDTFDINTACIILNKTIFRKSFNAAFNSSVEIEIPETDGEHKSVTVITFASLDNVLPARDYDNSLVSVIRGRVVLVQSSGDIDNISLTFNILNDTLGNPKCVFWNFSLFNGLGGWDDEGCELVLNMNETVNGTVTCNCNHLTSFSILMSPNIPRRRYLDIITYIGVGLSMGSLVICLIIEALIWTKIRKNETSYLRHVSIVNIAVSLLIANIWFIIGAAISDAEVKKTPACTASTFFIHFFYLALFFWMLASALLQLYRTIDVFSEGLSKGSMLAIGFSLGYGAPLIISAITIAVTAPDNEYIQDKVVCWLNWDESKALLAFVIPALLIVVINLIILLVVLYKIVRRRVGQNAAQANERHVLVVIAKSLAVFTPFFGITWGLGAGILADPENKGIHIAFAFFNSLQGFFILVFGTLLDPKVWSGMVAVWSQCSRSGRSGTRSTTAGNPSSGLGFLMNWRRGRDGYNVSSIALRDLNAAASNRVIHT